MAEKQDQYAWLSLTTRLRWMQDDHDNDRPDLSMSMVTARAGFFEQRLPPAVNDQVVAAVLVLLYIWLLGCAKSRANFRVYQARPRKINAGPIFLEQSLLSPYFTGFQPISLYPASQCQNGHLVTNRCSPARKSASWPTMSAAP